MKLHIIRDNQMLHLQI